MNADTPVLVRIVPLKWRWDPVTNRMVLEFKLVRRDG